MKKVQVRLSEQTYEDLVRIADGVPLQRFLERMVDEAIMRVVEPPTGGIKPANSQPPQGFTTTMLERQAKLNKGRAK